MKTPGLPNVGVVGGGYWGRNLIRNFSRVGVLRAFCDSSPTVLAEQSALYPAAMAVADFDALLSETGVDAVAIATPAETHGSLVRRALAAGKHVFVEKPLCLDVGEALALRAEAGRIGRVLMVGHLLLYHPAFRALQTIVARGDLGDIRYIYSNRLSLGKIRREENALWSFAPHDISMILGLLTDMPTEVAATGGYYLRHDVADTTLSHLQFASGVQAHIFVSWLHPYKEQKLIVVGSRAMAVFDDTLQGPAKLQLFTHEVGWSGNDPVINKADGQPVPYDQGEPLYAECQAFVDAVVGRAAPPSDADEGIRVLKVLAACQESLAAGGVRVPLSRELS